MKSREITTTIYTSNDGNDFVSEKECIKYEEEIKFNKDMKSKYGSVFLVYRRGQRGETVEAFSTKDLAKLSLSSISDISKYNIVEVYINFRLWKQL